MPTTSGSKKKSARNSTSSVDGLSGGSGGSARRARSKKAPSSSSASERPELSNEANFPPCYPIIRHSLGDLLTPLKKVCAIYAMIVWGVNIAVLILNFVGSFLFMAGTDASEASLIMVLVSFLYVIVIPLPTAFTHYWPLYLACRSGNAIMYAVFFFFWAVSIVFNVVMIIGVPHLGSCGILTMIVLAFKSATVGWVGLAYHFVVVLGWLCMIILQVIGIVLMYPNYKGDNGNLVELQNQIIGKIKGLRSKAAFGGVQNVV